MTVPSPQPRIVIVNADDFGMSTGINRGIARAYEQGILTSASLMTRWPAARAAAEYAREHPDLSVGLHLDLGEWVYRNENWETLYEVVSTDDATGVAEELDRQIGDFRRLVGRDPTHLDSHQHVHRDEPVRSLAIDWSKKLSVPLRHLSPSIRYCGHFYGQTADGKSNPQAISVQSLLNVLYMLSPGITELACHPGDPTDLQNPYSVERGIELASLCDPATRAALASNRIVLRSFATVRERGR